MRPYLSSCPDATLILLPEQADRPYVTRALGHWHAEAGAGATPAELEGAAKEAETKAEAKAAEDAKKAIAAEQKKTLEHLYALQRRMVEIRTEAKQEDTEEHNEWKEALAQARAEEEEPRHQLGPRLAAAHVVAEHL